MTSTPVFRFFLDLEVQFSERVVSVTKMQYPIHTGNLLFALSVPKLSATGCIKNTYSKVRKLTTGVLTRKAAYTVES